MSTTTIYENPLLFKDLSVGEIKYNNIYPFIEYENKVISNSSIFLTLVDVTMKDARIRTIMEEDTVGMSFKYNFQDELTEETIGEATLYGTGTGVVTAGSSVMHKTHLYLKRNVDSIAISHSEARYERDYQGGLDYVSLKVPDADFEKIKEKVDNLNENLNNNLETNKPDYAGYWTYMYNDKQQIAPDITEYGVEFYLYVWETMNSPWFTRYGTRNNLTPLIDNLADENGEINLYESNPDYTNPVGINWPDDRHGRRLYTLNYTSDFAADTSSNFVKIFRITPKDGERYPKSVKINMIAPKFSTYYFIWTYRYINCGNIIIKDLGSMTVEGNERTIPLSGIPPLYTPGIKIGQENIDNVSNWKWDHLDFTSWGRNIENYAVLNVERIFKPKRPPKLRYYNQMIKIEIPSEEIKDLSENFINRYKPDRAAPKYKTWEGDIYIHPYEDNEIIKCWYNIYVFKDTTQHRVQLTDGTIETIPLIKNLETNGEEFTYIFKYNSESESFFDRLRLFDASDNIINKFTKGNKYRIQLIDNIFQLFPIEFSLTEDGTNKNNSYEYTYNIKYYGEQGLSTGYVEIDVTYDFPLKIYYYLKGETRQGTFIDILEDNESVRNYYSSTTPYLDRYNTILYDDKVDISDNELYLETIPDCNFDYDDVPFLERGELANKDSSGNSVNLLLEDKALAEQKVLEPEWFAYEEYTPDNTQILRSYLEDYVSLPYYVHILDVPPGAGWFVRYKKNKLLPKSSHYFYDLSSNVYYIRWNYSYRKYHYTKTDYTNPRLLSYTVTTTNVGISPSNSFDFTDYGKLYIPKQVIFTYSNIEYPDRPKEYYKNLNISVNSNELMDLSQNIVYNTDLGCSISLQIYVIKPKNRLDADQNDPLIDLKNSPLDYYDLSFNLPAYPNRFPDTLSIDISDNGIKETTLLPGRYIAIWSYDVIHSFINPLARNYPILPNVDYDASANYIDIGYNDFLYDNIEPFFQIPNDLTRMTIEISGVDIAGLLNIRDTYLHTLSENTEITFNFLLWSPNYEWTQLLSGNRRWELPDAFQGEEDPRIREVPVVYNDVTGIVPMQRCYLGNDNSDSVGAIYNWGFGGEPGIQYRKITYHDISNNQVYNRHQYIDIDTSDNAIEIDSSYWLDPSAVNFIIDFYLPATDLSLNTAHYGFGSGPMDVLTFNDDAFHIGINGNGIDDVRIDTGMELPIDQQDLYINNHILERMMYIFINID